MNPGDQAIVALAVYGAVVTCWALWVHSLLGEMTRQIQEYRGLWDKERQDWSCERMRLLERMLPGLVLDTREPPAFLRSYGSDEDEYRVEQARLKQTVTPEGGEG